jgi:peptide/nickel transport system substrate-binding protein
MKSIITYISTLCVLTFVSCGRDSTNKDHLVFRYNESANITSLDPAFSKYNLMGLQSHFQWFTQLDEIKYQPDIAKSWTISPDAKPILLRCERIFSKAHFIW